MNRMLCLSVSLVTITAASGVTASSIAEPRVERLDDKHVIITWIAISPVDVSRSDRADADRSQAKLLSRGDRDGRHVASVTDSRRSYFLLRDQVDGSVVRVSERVLPLERGSNFRDIGGYEAADGKRVRWGLIYRSGATPMLSDQDVAYVRALGLRSMIDLRSIEERQLVPSRLAGQGIPYIAVDYSFNTLLPQAPSETGVAAALAATSAYHELLTGLAPQFRAIFLELLSNKAPLRYNCTAGQDRTGVATALILSALGVPRPTIMQDYHLSTAYRHPEYEAPIVDAEKYPGNPIAAYFSKAPARPEPLYTSKGHALLADAFDEIDARWGSVESYLDQVLGVDSAELAMLRERYLE